MELSDNSLLHGKVIGGIVRRDVSPSSQGWVTFLGPWWVHATAQPYEVPLRMRLRQINEVPLRVRLRQLDDTARTRLAPGASVQLACTDFERPRKGAYWWGALGVPLVSRQGNAQCEPVLLHDRLLCTLMLDRRANAFVGRRRGRLLYSLRIERTASVDHRDADRQEVERARAIVRTCEVEMRRIHNEVAARARRLYNKRWRCDRQQLSREEVARRMRLSSLTVGRDGNVHLSFSDGDLFYGYAINASLSNLRLRLVTIGVSC